ncbi:Nuclear transport factor 2 (NTF2) family protein, partial [Thalictrum thalictroides]
MFPSTHHQKICSLQFSGKKQTSSSSTSLDTETEKNVLLKLAWYSSELLGIAASFFRSPPTDVEAQERDVDELVGDEAGVVDRAQIMENIKEDFERSYFIT